MWRDERISDRRVVITAIEGFQISFFREHRDGSVWTYIMPPADRSFDVERPPVLWVDDDAQKHDLAGSKAMQHISDQFPDPDHPDVHFIGEADSMIARVWHGKPAEGMGFIGKILAAQTLSAIFYMDDYAVLRASVPLDAPDVFRVVLEVR
ncbi:MAG: hypothetical protein OJJ21_11755 [Ferrovibrio sp.]|uniref:hypothetical protein n=1 Tax=Ferrovibrio sp. TaxID=1917215 RepID=UPI002611A8D1|nr:hypothetical protein [Ferrovibrio sp.]MCW0234264.1 hypothetical protein [Ferrovibrio sp.]